MGYRLLGLPLDVSPQSVPESFRSRIDGLESPVNVVIPPAGPDVQRKGVPSTSWPLTWAARVGVGLLSEMVLPAVFNEPGTNCKVSVIEE